MPVCIDKSRVNIVKKAVRRKRGFKMSDFVICLLLHRFSPPMFCQKVKWSVADGREKKILENFEAGWLERGSFWANLLTFTIVTKSPFA